MGQGTKPLRGNPSGYAGVVRTGGDSAMLASEAIRLVHQQEQDHDSKWRRLANAEAVPAPAVSFIPVALPAPTAAPQQDIRMELRRGAMTMTITWPATAAADCAAWMRELLR